MKNILIRPADVTDAAAISAVHCSGVVAWRAGDRSARYADLTPFQRWQHGGPWMDAGLCAGHLRRLLEGGGLPVVAEAGGRVAAEAELHPAEEPPPFGRTMNLSALYVHRNHQRQGLGSALMEHAFALAEGFDTFTVAHAEAPDFYRRHGLRAAGVSTRFRLSTRVGKVRYTTEPLPDAPYDLIRGCGLPVGRYQNARHDWERTRPGATPDFHEWRGLRLERWWLRIGDHMAALILEESPDQAGVADTFLFTLSPLAAPLLSAVRDLAARSGFTHLICFAPAISGAIPTDYRQQLLMKRL